MKRVTLAMMGVCCVVLFAARLGTPVELGALQAAELRGGRACREPCS